ncbi:MAG: PepSY-like domain-containing protein [Proteiniphilum sp.]|nr:PepSY-like domain-containing protein [Proteiniphilum sp.]
MKTLKLMVVLFAVASFTACAQKNTAPEKVLNAFTQKFPTAQKVKWDKENETEWEAEFKLMGEEYSANFTADGQWLETEYEIEKADIPANVKQTLDNEFAGYKIEEAEISETAKGKVYEFALEKGKTEMEVAISPDGQVVKKEVKAEEKKEND